MDIKEVQQALKEIGWPIAVDGEMDDQTHNAIKDFQRGFAWWDLLIDGHVGHKTEKALKYCLKNDGLASEHFRFAEWKSKGNGWIRIRRELVRGLEEYRDAVGGPVSVVSGYRDPAHNTKVGGAANSQHLYGNAADVSGILTSTAVKSLRQFSGIGIRRADSRVLHVDVRHLGPNTTNGSPAAPTIWFYG